MRAIVVVMISLFWISLLGLMYVYVGYPGLIWLVAHLRPRPVDTSRDPGGSLSVILVAHNEAAVLGRKIESLLGSTITDRIAEIIVASDGSDDDTVAVIAGVNDPRIRCLAFAERRGKAACINDAVASAGGDILILTDARQMVAPDALEALVRSLGDDSVGAVSGELVFRKDSCRSATGKGMGAYWAYETFLRGWESLAGSVPGATGALYALRRDLFRPLRIDTILDDVYLPMKAVEQGYRCVLASGAYVYDDASGTPAAEGARKRRTLTGCVQLIRRHPRWLVDWRFFGHKVARLASPLLLIGLFVGSRAAWEPLFWMQVLVYAVVAVAWVPVVRGARIPVVGSGVLFVALNLTTLAALWDGVRGRYDVAWK